MRFQIKAAESLGKRTSMAFVSRAGGRGGLQPVTMDEYPPSPEGERLREVRTKGLRHVTLGKAARLLGMTVSQYSGLEHGEYRFLDPADWQTAEEILKGNWPKRADGWPLCPVCNEDELGCMDMARDHEALAGNVVACLERDLFCHRCARTFPGGTFSRDEVET